MRKRLSERGRGRERKREGGKDMRKRLSDRDRKRMKQMKKLGKNKHNITFFEYKCMVRMGLI